MPSSLSLMSLEDILDDFDWLSDVETIEVTILRELQIIVQMSYQLKQQCSVVLRCTTDLTEVNFQMRVNFMVS